VNVDDAVRIIAAAIALGLIIATAAGLLDGGLRELAFSLGAVF
jgi:hypothetical protein